MPDRQSVCALNWKNCLLCGYCRIVRDIVNFLTVKIHCIVTEGINKQELEFIDRFLINRSRALSFNSF